jgi:hypothetical protein
MVEHSTIIHDFAGFSILSHYSLNKSRIFIQTFLKVLSETGFSHKKLHPFSKANSLIRLNHKRQAIIEYLGIITLICVASIVHSVAFLYPSDLSPVDTAYTFQWLPPNP